MTMFTLRPYQRAAVDAAYQYLRTRDDNPCVVIPTGGGKTPVIATICKDAVGQWGGRVLILAHVKELLEQATEKLLAICPEINAGVYSAGLNRRETDHSVIVAGVQSVYKRACDLDAFDLIIADEAHLITVEGDGMYRQFLADAKKINPYMRVIGLTATPYRMKSGLICGPDNILNAVCFEVGIRELIRDGYLCQLVSKAGRRKTDVSQLHIRGGEFVAGEVEDLMDQDALVEAACAEIVEQTVDRNACLIFASGVRHGRHVVRVLAEKHGIECGFVGGETPADQRSEILTRFRGAQDVGLFRSPPLKYLCNVNVLTTGFDSPNIDCVVLLRPTLSPGLYYQMAGRGFRLHPSKQNCLVLDFGGNVLRHGPVDQIKINDRVGDSAPGAAPAKECPECHSVVAAGYAKCPECGYEFPPPDRQKHDAKASVAGILSGEVTVTTYSVTDALYSVHVKNGADVGDPKTLRVDYIIGWHKYKSEWICFEHSGYALQKAIAWWKRHSHEPVPETAQEAVEIAKAGGLAETKSITVRAVAGEKYERIVDYELGEIPELASSHQSNHYQTDDIPF
jgi:DNA repair protein RadD